MTQQPKGEVVLRTADGEEPLALSHENLYVRSIRLFQEAAAGRGAPAATGEDGVRSLASRSPRSRPRDPGRETSIDRQSEG